MPVASLLICFDPGMPNRRPLVGVIPRARCYPGGEFPCYAPKYNINRSVATALGVNYTETVNETSGDMEGLMTVCGLMDDDGRLTGQVATLADPECQHQHPDLWFFTDPETAMGEFYYSRGISVFLTALIMVAITLGTEVYAGYAYRRAAEKRNKNDPDAEKPTGCCSPATFILVTVTLMTIFYAVCTEAGKLAQALMCARALRVHVCARVRACGCPPPGLRLCADHCAMCMALAHLAVLDFYSVVRCTRNGSRCCVVDRGPFVGALCVPFFFLHAQAWLEASLTISTIAMGIYWENLAKSAVGLAIAIGVLCLLLPVMPMMGEGAEPSCPVMSYMLFILLCDVVVLGYRRCRLTRGAFFT